MNDEDNSRRGDILVTVSKLIGIMTALLAVTAFVFRLQVKAEVDALRLEMVKTYATRGDVLMKVEYEIRHAEMQRQVDAADARAQDSQRRLDVIERSLIRNGNGK